MRIYINERKKIIPLSWVGVQPSIRKAIEIFEANCNQGELLRLTLPVEWEKAKSIININIVDLPNIRLNVALCYIAQAFPERIKEQSVDTVELTLWGNPFHVAVKVYSKDVFPEHVRVRWGEINDYLSQSTKHCNKLKKTDSDISNFSIDSKRSDTYAVCWLREPLITFYLIDGDIYYHRTY